MLNTEQFREKLVRATEHASDMGYSLVISLRRFKGIQGDSKFRSWVKGKDRIEMRPEGYFKGRKVVGSFGIAYEDQILIDYGMGSVEFPTKTARTQIKEYQCFKKAFEALASSRFGDNMLLSEECYSKVEKAYGSIKPGADLASNFRMNFSEKVQSQIRGWYRGDDGWRRDLVINVVPLEDGRCGCYKASNVKPKIKYNVVQKHFMRLCNKGMRHFKVTMNTYNLLIEGMPKGVFSHDHLEAIEGLLGQVVHIAVATEEPDSRIITACTIDEKTHVGPGEWANEVVEYEVPVKKPKPTRYGNFEYTVNKVDISGVAGVEIFIKDYISGEGQIAARISRGVITKWPIEVEGLCERVGMTLELLRGLRYGNDRFLLDLAGETNNG